MSKLSLQESLLLPNSETLCQPISPMDTLIKRFRTWDPHSNKLFTGHTGAIWCCTMTSNNKTLFSSSEDQTIKVWDTNTQSLIHTFTLHSSTINILELVHNEKYLISGDWDGKIYVWNWKSKSVFKEFKAGVSVFASAVSQCGKFLVTGGGEPLAAVWDLETFSLLGKCNSEVGSILTISISNDSSKIVCGGFDGFIRVFNSSDFTMNGKWAGGAGIIQTMKLTKDDRFLIIGTRNNLVRIFSFQEQKEYFTFKSHENWVRNIVVTEDSKYCISASADSSVRIFNIVNKIEEFCLEGNGGYVFAEYLSRDGKFLLTGASDKHLRLWEIGTVEKNFELVGHKETVTCLAITADDKFVITGSEDSTVRMWSLEKFCEVAVLKAHTSIVWGVAVTNDSKYIGSVSADKKFILWNFATKNQVLKLEKHEGAVFCVAFTHNSQLAITGAGDKNLIVWSVNKKKDPIVLVGHTDSVFCVTVTFDNKFAVSGSADYTIIVWNLETMTQENKIKPKSGMIQSLCTSSDGKFLVFGDRANKVHLWDWQTQKPIKKFTHNRSVRSLCFSKDNKLFASASNDSTVRIWNPYEERQELLLRGQSALMAVSFTRDLKFVVVAGMDSKIKLWNIKDTETLELADSCSSLDSFLYLAQIKMKQVTNPEFLSCSFGQLHINLLHFCAYLGYNDLLTDFLKRGVEIKTDTEGHSPLFYALQRSSQNCVDSILKFMIKLKQTNIKQYLSSCHAVRNDIEALLSNHSVHLPEFIEEIFYTVSDLPNFAVPKSPLPIFRLYNSKTVTASNFVFDNEDNPAGAEEIPIEFKTLPFQVAFQEGSSASLQLLERITNCPNKKILQTKFIKSYIHIKWSNLWPFILFLTFILWTNILLMVLAISKLSNHNLQKDSSSKIFPYLFSYFFVNIFLVCYEVIQAITTGHAYLNNFWNIIDILRSALCVMWPILSFSYTQDELFLVTWTMVVLNFFRGLTGFRAFDSTRYYTRLIFRVFSDSISFLFIFFYSTLAFGVLYFVSIDNSEIGIFDIWRVPYELNMGEIINSNEHPAVYVFFMLGSVFNVIIILNLLISILGDSFESFQMDAAQVDCLEMAELVLEIEELMFWRRGMNQKQHLQVCQRLQGQESLEWEGKAQMIVASMKKMRAEMREEFGFMQNKIDLLLENSKQKSK